MRKHAAYLALAGACSLLLSCNPLLSGPLPSGMADSTIVQHVPYTGSFTYTVDPGATARDVYFVFTNPSLTQNASQAPTVSGASLSVDGQALPAPVAQPLPSFDTAPRSMADRIAEFNRNPYAHVPRAVLTRPSAQVVSPAGSDSVGLGQTFCTDIDSNGNATSTAPAVCQAVVGPVDLGDGRTRTLSIWVDSRYPGEVTATMVNDIASRFLQNSASLSDIYRWDTAVIGEPWGPQNFSNLIAWDANNTVTILLTHLNPDAAYAPNNPVIVGFYWAKDNFTSASIPGSNERIMFYLDSKLYGTLETTGGYNELSYSATNYWPKFIFSTLAHEFQHMIQFYQKQILYDLSSSTDTWINEMCSMMMEDLVAQNQAVEGPRGVLTGDAGTPPVKLGRLPQFNAASSSSLAVTGSNFDLIDYSVAYAFGAWLIRNYGGPDLLKRIVQCAQTDSTAVVNAAAAYSGTTESMQKLLERWSASVLLSDTTGAPPGYRYNTGGWNSFTAGSQSFSLGSIDFFNYSPQPTMYSAASPLPAPPSSSSNVYFKAAGKLSSSRTFSVKLPAGVEMTVVLK
jgi:hypothetical protein